MKKYILLIATLLLFSFSNKERVLTTQELDFIELINNYRSDNNLNSLQINYELCKIADYHIEDLMNNKHLIKDDNLHDWSDCDYQTNDCMNNKIKQLTSYDNYACEIIYYNSGKAKVYNSFVAFSKSEPHNNVMINKKGWENIQFNYIGISISENFVSIWFGK